jgi:hypothetical protein
MEIAKILVSAIYLYLFAGLVFAVLFLWRGVAVLDDSAKGISAKTKALLFPGTVALWPVLLQKWLRATRKSGLDDVQGNHPVNDSEPDSALLP